MDTRAFASTTEKLSIVTDPYTPDRAGLKRVTDEVDVVVMSSTGGDAAHSYAEMFPAARLRRERAGRRRIATVDRAGSKGLGGRSE